MLECVTLAVLERTFSVMWGGTFPLAIQKELDGMVFFVGLSIARVLTSVAVRDHLPMSRSPPGSHWSTSHRNDTCKITHSIFSTFNTGPVFGYLCSTILHKTTLVIYVLWQRSGKPWAPIESVNGLCTSPMLSVKLCFITTAPLKSAPLKCERGEAAVNPFRHQGVQGIVMQAGSQLRGKDTDSTAVCCQSVILSSVGPVTDAEQNTPSTHRCVSPCLSFFSL